MATVPELPDESTDQLWWSLIEIAERMAGRIGKFHNTRYDRHCVYTCQNVRELACMLIETGIIQRWQGGIRKLSTIESQAKQDFYTKHGKFHTDT